MKGEKEAYEEKRKISQRCLLLKYLAKSLNEGGAISGRGGHEGHVRAIGKEKDKLSVLDKTYLLLLNVISLASTQPSHEMWRENAMKF